MGERIQHGAAPTGPEPSQAEAPDLKALKAENERLKATNRELHRRMQAAEGPLLARAENAERAAAYWLRTRREAGRRSAGCLQRAIQAEAALAESERKRVEERAALAALYEWYDRDGSVGGANDVFSEHRALLATPTQETPDDQG